MGEKNSFWAQKIAGNVRSRKRFRFLKKKIPEQKSWSVKSSSSLSGVLHIGRLSDILRGEAVYRALKEKGFPAEFIYVTEDMDPLRKIPKGVPKKFSQFIGFPVSDVPDPEGCHKSYAEHFLDGFFSSAEKFLEFFPKKFSMREEYRKGSFNSLIKEIIENTGKVKKIIEETTGARMGENWSPWKPICDSCGNMQTTVVEEVDGKTIHYSCRDYSFEKFTAKGCGHEGKSSLSNPDGKLVWKSEWAAQWKKWGVCSEGAGKEYEAKNSAFWVNAGICEKILSFPSPEPIFYEHLMVDGVKMSASLGNVVYPQQWLSVSRPETLKMLFMKRINRARSFSWNDVPGMELELDRALAEAVEKKSSHSGKLTDFSRTKRPLLPVPVDYSTAAMVVQLSGSDENAMQRMLDAGFLTGKESGEQLELLRERVSLARNWVKGFAPEEARFSLKEREAHEAKDWPMELKDALRESAKVIESAESPEELQKSFMGIAKKKSLPPKKFYEALYTALTGKSFGPKAGPLIFALGKEKAAEILKKIR